MEARYRDSSQIQIQLAFRYRDEWHSGTETGGSQIHIQMAAMQVHRQVAAKYKYRWQPIEIGCRQIHIQVAERYRDI